MPQLREALRDVAWVAVAFLVLAIVAALLWWQVAAPPSFVRTADNAVMDQAELAKKVRADGWFVVIGVLGSAALGAGFAARRRRDPLLILLAGVVASLLAGALTLWLGQRLGHHDVRAELVGAKVGDRVPASLEVISRSVLLAWPIGFLVGDLAVLLGLPTQGAVASYGPEAAEEEGTRGTSSASLLGRFRFETPRSDPQSPSSPPPPEELKR